MLSERFANLYAALENYFACNVTRLIHSPLYFILLETRLVIRRVIGLARKEC